MKSILIIDTFNLLFRSYYAMRNFRNENGEPNGMLLGLANKLAELNNLGFSRVVFAADSSGGSFRNELLPEYKANRKELEPELKAQIPIALNMLASAGYLLIERAGYEADDIIASLSKSAEKEGFSEIYILSTDKDLFCLINERTKIMGKDSELYGEAECLQKFGVRPSQIRDYLALIGDSADNFKGVPGVGPAAAKRLLGEFESLEGVYASLNLAGTKGLIKKLEEGKESAFLSQKLATLVDDLDVIDALKGSCVELEKAYASLANEFARWGLNRHARAASALASTLNDQSQLASDNQKADSRISQNKDTASFSAALINDADELMRIINAAPSVVAFDTETTGLERNARCVGFSFAYEEANNIRAFYVPLAHISSRNISHEDARTALLALFSRCVVGHNLIFDFRVIAHNFNIALPVKFVDSMVLSWLAKSDGSHSLDAQSKLLFNHSNVEFSSLVPKGAHFGELAAEDAYFYAAEDAAMSLKIAQYYDSRLSEPERKAAVNEFKFLRVLFNMQERGIEASKLHLIELEGRLNAKIKELEPEIYALAKREFNIASPKQLAEILYDELGLKAPSNRSTNESVLSSLDHPIIALVLDFRECAKLLSTYVKPLLAIAGRANDRFCIHANFLQTGTATGRISCAKPNLQNIPARGNWAKDIKSAFKAREGKVFVSLDYSQIELRMLAHFSGDRALCEAFLNGADIHAQVAAECFGDASKRQLAKAINFGLIYGMGARSLAADLGISMTEAKGYIDAYFDRFASVRAFFDKVKNQAREAGYISTLAGRRRYFEYGKGARIDAAHERECINSMLQGSAADLIKTAMIRANEQLLGEHAALLLQVHDELIFEVDEAAAADFAPKAAAIMQNAAALRVPLSVSVAIGKTLAELK